MFNVHAYEPSQKSVRYKGGKHLFFPTMNKLIEWPSDTKHRGQQNMQKRKKNNIFLFSFFPKCIFFNKCFVFNLAQGRGFNRGKAHYITRWTVRQDEIHKKKSISSEKGKVCNKVSFSYFAFVLHRVSVNHAFQSPTSTQQKSSSDICKDHFLKKESKKHLKP